MSYAGIKVGYLLKTIAATKELSKLRDRKNGLEHSVSILNETTIKMDDYITSNYGNIKSIIVDFVLNEIKTFSIINTIHSKSIDSLKQSTELNENYKYLIEYINDYNIYTGEFFKEVVGIEQHIVLTQAISRKLSESWGDEGINKYSDLDLGKKESLKVSVFDETFAELEKNLEKNDSATEFLKKIKKLNVK